jgi:hypothetical protein
VLLRGPGQRLDCRAVVAEFGSELAGSRPHPYFVVVSS